MTPRALLLEDFVDASDQGLTDQPWPQQTRTYDEGYADGLAAAEATFAADQSALTTDLLTCLAALQADRAAMAAQVLEAVRPLHVALLTSLLPGMLAPALVAHLRDLVDTATAKDLSAPLTLRVSEAQQDTILAALSGFATTTVSVVADPTLGPHAALLTTPHGETALDLDAAFAAIATYLGDAETHFLTASKEPRHGRPD